MVFAVAASAALCVQGTPDSAHAEAPKAAVEGELSDSLRDAITNAVGETDKPIENRFEARRRAREAAEDAVAVLRSEGYYANTVEAEVTETEPAQPVVKVAPGQRFTIQDPKVEWIAPEPAPGVQIAGEAVLGLANGQAGRAADVLGAEGRIVAAVRKRGYADVTFGDRQVIVDHADHSVRPTFRIVSGELVLLDGIDLVTPGRTNPTWLRGLAPWKAGEPYDPDDVGELERRLLDTGVYDSVTVALAGKEKATAEGLRPVIVSISDRKRRTLELGASYSTSEGVGADARWTRYNVLGRADTLSYYGRASTVDSRLGGELTLPHWRRAQQTLKGQAGLYRVHTDAYDETGVGVRADIERRFGKTSHVTVGASLDYSETQELQAVTLSSLGRKLVTASVLGAMALDRSDDPLDPKRGWRVEARLEPTLIVGADTLPYLKAQSQGSIYFPFDEKGRTVVAGRLKLGSAIGGLMPEVPASRRFYSGGGGSVRGYAYQAIGPRLADNTPQGGLSLFEGSVELRQKIGKRWGVVAFVDAGSVGSDQIPSFKDLSVGAGIGVRYDLGFGPIRADIAIPLEKRKGDAAFQIYLSIGQSF
ncbi:MAG: autotransporter assembly complex family protein [Phenylobacterium sp.]|uniref:Autotransporter assembly complex protein TamA n=1 Tax=Phenylobacterium ferrooxidans TaxID=2982689 RepID=A0ABW6CT04_9CAUL|nr:autotransporter assembly complex family protein [Phenylobacterium sp.]MDP2010239.1 autotransporter assembly complex family protein [Phenylobacterium sp.]MDP3635464.1 autotransporter assembly complex family protein [Phenylobacterium sp.]MDP3869224.1 autotransporter assembly complex family protein [Phenylobacterium sp.]